MAGEWLKFEKATPEKQEVFSIASHLDINPDEVVGKLIRVWSWFDTHTTDGHGASVTPALLDRVAGVTGFVRAMERVGWIRVAPEGVSLPNFERHTGETAKGRALSAQRSSNHRAKRHAPTVTDAVTNLSPREEKRREDKDQEPASEFLIPADDGSEFAIPADLLSEYRATYRRVDVAGELRKARAWCVSNPGKRKTRRGIPKFLNSWLSGAEAEAIKNPLGGAAEWKASQPGGGRREL